MIKTVKDLFSRSSVGMIEDAVGIIALFLLVFAVLSMPGSV
jgi:hypothetical protein